MLALCGAAWFLSFVPNALAIAGDPVAQADADPSDAISDEVLKPLSGRRVYKRVCMACHTLSVWGAPKLGDHVAWAPRISKGRPALYFSAQNGLNEMPPRGNCDFCTDDELRAAVDYLVEKAQPRRRDD
ncbi:MAG: cytochrome c5 family protein [bacterium]|nr:cytochrome c5 family protein [bacterium]